MSQNLISHPTPETTESCPWHGHRPQHRHRLGAACYAGRPRALRKVYCTFFLGLKPFLERPRFWILIIFRSTQRPYRNPLVALKKLTAMRGGSANSRSVVGQRFEMVSSYGIFVPGLSFVSHIYIFTLCSVCYFGCVCREEGILHFVLMSCFFSKRTLEQLGTSCVSNKAERPRGITELFVYYTPVCVSAYAAHFSKSHAWKFMKMLAQVLCNMDNIYGITVLWY